MHSPYLSSPGTTGAARDTERYYGVYIAIVTANADEDDHTFRVKVRFPWMENGGKSDKTQDSSCWARIATPFAGEMVGNKSYGPRGAFFLPELEDEVLVAFAHGDFAQPVIVGRLWSDCGPEASAGSGDTPNHPVYAHTQQKGVLTVAVDDQSGITAHAATKHEKNKNDLCGIRTRSGHLLVFNDNEGEPAIYLRSSKAHRIELVDGGNKGILIADPKNNYIWLKSESQGGDIEMYTAGNVKIKADKDINIEAGQKIITKSGAETNMKMQKFSLKSDSEMTLQAGSSGTIKAGSQLTLAAPRIALNKN